jgi:hypothetical protein
MQESVKSRGVGLQIDLLQPRLDPKFIWERPAIKVLSCLQVSEAKRSVLVPTQAKAVSFEDHDATQQHGTVLTVV